MTDTIELTIPANVRFRPVATLVLSGIGSRLELSYERIDDLELAVLSALEAADGDSVTMNIEVDDNGLLVSLGPLVGGSGSDERLLLVLGKLVDSVQAASRNGNDWLTLALERAPSIRS